MNNKAYGTVNVVNVVIQAIFTVLIQAGLFTLIAWLIVKFLGAPECVYRPFILFGVLSGLFTMVRFIISAMQSLERLEAQGKEVEGAPFKEDGQSD